MTTATAIREKPILFSAPMVRAILEGRKHCTRRVVVPQPKSPPAMAAWSDGKLLVDHLGRVSCIWPADYVDEESGLRPDHYATFPYGSVGDRLWVRETWMADIQNREIAYAATDQHLVGNEKWKPSIHMPRTASRITLEITGVRVERVQEITEDDAIAEGVQLMGLPSGNVGLRFSGKHAPAEYLRPIRGDDKWTEAELLRAEFASLWDAINAKRGFGWDANPWVWVIEFKRVETEAT